MPEWERLANNYQLSEHLRWVQDLLNQCRSSGRPEQLFEGEITQDWYRSCKAGNTRPVLDDLLCRSLAASPNCDDIDTGTDRAQIATNTLISTSDIVKKGT